MRARRREGGKRGGGEDVKVGERRRRGERGG